MYPIESAIRNLPGRHRSKKVLTLAPPSPSAASCPHPISAVSPSPRPNILSISPTHLATLSTTLTSRFVFTFRVLMYTFVRETMSRMMSNPAGVLNESHNAPRNAVWAWWNLSVSSFSASV